jgi:hypothetical protein
VILLDGPCVALNDDGVEVRGAAEFIGGTREPRGGPWDDGGCKLARVPTQASKQVPTKGARTGGRIVGEWTAQIGGVK